MRFVGLTIALVATLLLAAVPAYACSMVAFSLLREPEVLFMGTATTDTVLAGPGEVSYRNREGQLGGATERPIYGQVVRVGRVGGPAAEQLPDGVAEVVVVRWSVDPSCIPMPWMGSAQWSAPGTRGLYVATLRAPEHWVDGRPTLDLRLSGAFPYTGVEPIPGLYAEDSAAPPLSPEQLFEVYRVLPGVGEIRARAPAVLEPLRAWARQHPDLASRPPARSLLRTVAGYVEGGLIQDELRRTDHPVLGTWRFTLRIPGDWPRTFFARTAAHPTKRWPPSPPPQARDPLELRIPPAEGWSFHARTARSLAALPETGEQAWDYVSGFLHVLARPDTTGEGTLQWRGVVDAGLLGGALPDGRLLRGVAREAVRQGLYTGAPARFTRGPDGVLRVMQLFPRRAGDPLVLEGERLSREVIRDRE